MAHNIDGIEVSTRVANTVNIGGQEVSMEMSMKEFFDMVMYVLTTTDIELIDDPRLKFVDLIKSLQLKEGRNIGHFRLQLPQATILPFRS